MKQFESNIGAIEIDIRYFGVNDMILKKYFAKRLLIIKVMVVGPSQSNI
jgi:hypothetical protein